MNRKAASKITRIVPLIIILLLTFGTQLIRAEPGSIIVPDDYATIQEAINAANAWDTILVRSGTYYGTLSIGKPLSLVGENNADTILDGNGVRHVIYLPHTNNVEIRGFTIRNGTFGILPQFSSDLIIEENIISDNTYDGIFLHASNCHISNNIIKDNGRSGIHLEFGGNTLRGNSFSNNTYNFGVNAWGSFTQDIDTSNLVDGKPIYYWIGQNDKLVPTDAGFLGLVNCRNITAKNLSLRKNGHGVLLAGTTNSLIENVSSYENGIGLQIVDSSNNTIKGNQFSSNDCGIYIEASTNNHIINNSICHSFRIVPATISHVDGLGSIGVYIRNCHNNTLRDNDILDSEHDAMQMRFSYNNRIEKNVISGGKYYGIRLESSNSNILNQNRVTDFDGGGIVIGFSNESTLEANVAENNRFGIYINSGKGNVLRENNMIDNTYNFGVIALRVDWSLLQLEFEPSDFIQDIDTSNTINGKPIYYIVNLQDSQLNPTTISELGFLGVVNSTGVSISGFELKDNVEGLLIATSSNLTISNLNVNSNHFGITFWGAHNNTVVTNELAENNIGMLLWASKDNVVFRNKFIDNERHAGTEFSVYSGGFLHVPPEILSIDAWDGGYSRGGNYWSDYTDFDVYCGPHQDISGSDGIWDHPYIVDKNNQDNYPLVNPWPSVPEGLELYIRRRGAHGASGVWPEWVVGTPEDEQTLYSRILSYGELGAWVEVELVVRSESGGVEKYRSNQAWVDAATWVNDDIVPGEITVSFSFTPEIVGKYWIYGVLYFKTDYMIEKVPYYLYEDVLGGEGISRDTNVAFQIKEHL